VGQVSNGRKAIDFCKSHDVDFVITDYDMPEMNGVDATKIISKQLGIPVCIYSEDNSVKAEALEAGAIIFELKPSFSSYSAQSMQLFIQRLIAALKDMVPSSHKTSEKETVSKEKKSSSHDFQVLCIGASTGGPTAVEEVLSGLGKQFPLPILYVQHIDIGSDDKMVQWFNKCCPNTPMFLAKDGDVAEKGKVYMAPANKHLVIDYLTDSGKPVLKLSDEPPERFLKPAVNKLFRSAANHYKSNCLAVLLTGMGRDGAEGCREIIDNGGFTIVEDKSTCAVFGMPAAAIELKAASKVFPRDIIAGEILKLV
jgi:two-component system chemotaxis response regulator CheB